MGKITLTLILTKFTKLTRSGMVEGAMEICTIWEKFASLKRLWR